MQWEKQYTNFDTGFVLQGEGSQTQSLMMEGSQAMLSLDGRSVGTAGSRPKTSGSRRTGSNFSKNKKVSQRQEADVGEVERSRYAGPISPVVTQIRRRPDSAGPMGMGRDFSHVHSTSPFGRDRFCTTTATATSSAVAAANLVPGEVIPIVTLDRCGRPAIEAPVKPVIDHDKRVCRYAAFFYEDRVWDKTCPIGTPSIEKLVVRHLVISYYLADSTVSIFEKQQENVGINGGMFFKRARLFKDSDSEPVGLRDLIPGKPLHVLGQEIMIRDADPYSRGVVQFELGIALPPALPKPAVTREDLGTHLALGMGRSPPPKRTDNLYPPPYDFYQRKEAVEKTKRFLFAERTPLRFECYELLDNVKGKLALDNLHAYRNRHHPDDPLTVPIHAQRLALLYFILDYQLEVCLDFKAGEKIEHDENKTVLKKSKLPKNWQEVRKGGAPSFFEPKDFVCGQPVNLYGKVYLLINCNAWSRDWYQKAGMAQPTDLVIKVEDPPLYVHEIPAHGDGNLAIGAPEETLATVYGHAHAAHALRKDFEHLGRQLRCKTSLITDKHGHDQRLFNLSFFMEDCSVQVYEEVVKNSGFPGGMFVKRTRLLNHLPPDQNEPRVFKAQDIYLGNVIAFNGMQMRIVEMDGATLRFCEQHPEDFPYSDVFTIILHLLNYVVENGLDVRKNFLSYDLTRSGSLSRQEFISSMDDMGLTEGLNDQELLTLIRRFKLTPQSKGKKNIFSSTMPQPDEDEVQEAERAAAAGEHKADSDETKPKAIDRYLYEELCDLFSHVHCVDTRKQKPAKGAQQVDGIDNLVYAARGCTTQWRRYALISLALLPPTPLTHHNPSSPLLAIYRVLRLDPSGVNGLISVEALVQCMKRYGVIMSEGTKRQIAARYAATRDESVRYLDRLEKRMAATSDAAKSIKMSDNKAAHDPNAMHQTTVDLPNSPNFVQTRREMLHRPVLRAVRGADSKHARVGSSSVTPLDYSQLVVSFRRLADDVYISDWCGFNASQMQPQ